MLTLTTTIRSTLTRQLLLISSRRPHHFPQSTFDVSKRSYGDERNLIQLFRDISDRSTRDRVRKNFDEEQNKNSTRISAAKLTSTFCRTYLSLPDTSLSQWRKGDGQQTDQKRQFLKVIFDEYTTDKNEVSSVIKSMQSQDLTDKSIHRLRDLCVAPYERSFHYILHSAQNDLGVAFLVKLRQDILNCMKYEYTEKGQQYELQAAQRCIQTFLTSLFRPGVLNLERITYDNTPAAIIEQIARKEAVHPVQSLNDLRQRLGPGRRCFAFFHPALPQRPLVFVHVSLLQQIPDCMEQIQIGSEKIVQGIDDEHDASCATFYSITNTEPGLAGVDLGNHLIKHVVKQLKEELPKLDTFCTLSPIPNLSKWLQGKIAIHQSIRDDNEMIFTTKDMELLERIFPHSSGNSPLGLLLETLQMPQWHTNIQLVASLKPFLLKLAAYYLTIDTHHGRPLCPVAKFHIRNGAEMFRLNYMADTTNKGMRNSYGLMINYRYPLEEIEENHARYEMTGKIKVNDGVNCWLQ